MSRLLPLFPLQLVALPGCAIPLHIFEDRYRKLVGEAEQSGTEFGIVLARDNGIVNAGCTVIVEIVTERYPDGRFDVIVRGRRRFSIRSLDEELDYLRGEVEYFEDNEWEPVASDLRHKALDAARQIDRAQGDEGGAGDPMNPLLSFRLAAMVRDLNFQDMILRSRSEAERLRKFVEFAESYVARVEYASRMKRVTPGNGSGHTPAGL